MAKKEIEEKFEALLEPTQTPDENKPDEVRQNVGKNGESAEHDKGRKTFYGKFFTVM